MSAGPDIRTFAQNPGSSKSSSRRERSIERFAAKLLNPRAMWWECWLMPVAPSRQHRHDGYARFGNRAVFEEIYAHRIVAAAIHGPIPDGYEVDHLCFTRNCVNPFHLAVVPLAANRHFQWQSEGRPNPVNETPAVVRRLREIRTAAECKRGHAWAEHAKTNSQGRRICAECARESGRRYDQRRRAS
jgi:hypothetical protein